MPVLLLKLYPGGDYSGADLSGMDLSNRALRGCVFDRADLTRTVFADADLTDTSFVDADLTGADFEDALLCRARLRGACVDGAGFVGADLSEADLRTPQPYDDNPDFRNANVDDARVNDWFIEFSQFTVGRPAGTAPCDDCGDLLFHSAAHSVENSATVCQRCLDDNYEWCDRCAEYERDACYDAEAASARLHEYSYRPDWVARGDGPLFGLELELLGRVGDLHDEVTDQDPHEELLFCKRDSSVDIEIVTHPMSLSWFEKNFPFQLLQRLADAEAHTRHDTGLHIHVDRNAFDGPRHVLTWQLLIYRNQHAVTTLARRDNHVYAGFGTQPGQLADSAKGGTSWRRGTAINCQNADTFELRMFRSTLNRRELEAAVQFAAASIEYTRRLPAAQVLGGNALSWARFVRWTRERPAYAALSRELAPTVARRAAA